MASDESIIPAERLAGPDSSDDEAARLRALGADVQAQDDVERNINIQADQLLAEGAIALDQKRLDKAKAQKEKLLSQVRKVSNRLSQPVLPPASTVRRLQNELDHYHAEISAIDRDIHDIEKRIEDRDGDLEAISDKRNPESGRLAGESQRDFLIRTGKITPFDRRAQPQDGASMLRDTLLQDEEPDRSAEDGLPVSDARSHVNLRRPGFRTDKRSSSPVVSPAADEMLPPPPPPSSKRRRTASHRNQKSTARNRHGSDSTSDEKSAESNFELDTSPETPGYISADSAANLQGDDSYDDDDARFQPELATKKRKATTGKGSSRKRTRGARHRTSDDSQPEADETDDTTDINGIDDGNETLYQGRLARWIAGRSEARKEARSAQYHAAEVPEDDECYLPHPLEPDLDLGDGYRLPGDIHPALFDYQKTGVQWLSELHRQEVGGIVGDEMGLGKTIQAISFLAGLHYSKMLTKPVIVVCPATVMKQWVSEFHTWWPPLRVSILHSSGSGMMEGPRQSPAAVHGSVRSQWTKAERGAEKLVRRVINDGHVLVTTYAGLQNYAEFLIPVDWGYAVLDEGHKIRNPNAAITIHCKELRTANRIILSGTPIQNNLVELWSLFDFVYPMRLGTLVTFRREFEDPIRMGGYSSANNLQVLTATKCAQTLKESIQPYLLQRLKVDVAADLPKKSEQVLFCKLTDKQRTAYKVFLAGEDVKSIHAGKRQALFGIDILRKICNHPDLAQHKELTKMPGYSYGDPKASGKMQIVRELLQLWSSGGHKTLLFCQGRLMLDILETFVQAMPDVHYRRMDGETAVKDRQAMVDEFNRDPDLHVFLLTTKVGGLGVNLTGADRVIIFDPDWNPSTDMQARERAWRLGQKREVKIYRLMTAGTIEEKIYYRQMFKQFITNKILKDPKQQQTFAMKDIHDLFTLDEQPEIGAASGVIATPTAPGDKHRATSVEKPAATSTSAEAEPADVAPPPAAKREDDESIRAFAGISSVGAGDDKTDEQRQYESQDAEQRLMTDLFARSGYSGTLEQDRIVNGRIEYSADLDMLERGARRRAAAAAKTLQKAAVEAKKTPAGTVTWTGAAGTAGRPASPPAASSSGSSRRQIGGSGSVGLLSNLRERQNGDAVRANGRTAVRKRGGTDPSAEDFGLMIMEFLNSRNGTVFSADVVRQFDSLCHTDKHTADFKAMLKEIATYRRNTEGKGLWVIRPEYRQSKPATGF